MKRTLTALCGVLSLLGAGCFSSQAPVVLDPCARLPAEQVARVTGVGVTLTEPETLGSGFIRCQYFMGEREILLQVTDDSASVSAFVTQLRNAFPTNNQPSIEEGVIPESSSALVTLQSGGMMLFVASGTGGYLLSNVANPVMTREMLIQLGTALAR
jgi:hypothetical protein